jgi:hypothetical protein
MNQIRAVLTLGTRRYDAHAAAVNVTLPFLPGVGACEALLPQAVVVDAEPGEGAGLELDAGDGAVSVVRGIIAGVSRAARTNRVTIADDGVRLARLRPTTTFQKQSGKDVVRSLASSAGVTAGEIDLELPLAAYVAHARWTGAEHVAYLSELGGAVARIDGEGRLQVSALSTSGGNVALRYGRELLELSISAHPTPPSRRVVIGNGPAGSPDAPDAMRPTADPLPSDAPSPGPVARWSPAPVLRTPSAASSASRAADRRAAAGTNRLGARCVLVPKLRPGHILDIQSIPDDPGGRPWMLTRVTHRIGPRGAETILDGISLAQASRAEDLVGSIASAVGGLL